jgi:peptidoglycan/LPS O-acetylase OafA/YrhL
MGTIRLLLAISVVMVHTTPIFGNTLVSGTIAVQAFYIISGFYMALILNEKYVGTEGSYKLFLTNRLLRIYPTYLVVFVLTVLIYAIPYTLWGKGGATLERYFQYSDGMWLGTKAGLLLSNLFLFGQDILMFFGLDKSSHAVVFAPTPPPTVVPMGHFLFVPQAWTIAIELTFYLIAPFLVRRSALVLISLIVASLVVRFATYSSGYNIDPWTYRFFPFELGFFLAGAVGYKVFNLIRNSQWADMVGKAGCAVVILATVFFSYVPGPFPLKQWIYYALFACAVPFIFLVSRKNRLDRWIGELSYPVYMSHMLMLGIIGYHTRWPHIPEKFLGLVVAVASIAFSVLLARFVIQPIETIRQSRVAQSQS